jgi:hypothetical protein
MWDTTTDNVPTCPVGLRMVWSGAAWTVLPTAAATASRRMTSCKQNAPVAAPAHAFRSGTNRRRTGLPTLSSR